MNKILKIELNKIVWSALISLAIVSFFILGGQVALASGYCSPGGSMSLDQFRSAEDDGKIISGVEISGSKANAVITNNTDCSFPAILVSFKVFGNTLESQRMFSNSGVVNIGPNKTTRFSADVASCMTQIDLYYGSGPGNNPVNEGGALITWAYANNNGYGYGSASQSGNLCNDNPPPPVIPDLIGSCSANPGSIQTGNSTTFTANATGGTGAYTYSWSDNSGTFGSSSSATKSYSTAGVKTATVLVTSGSQSRTANCNVTVTTPIEDLAVSCLANPSSINTGNSTTFTANATGGTGAYTYSWSDNSGTFGSSSSATKSYSTAGVKTATVLVTSGSQSRTANCNVTVNQIVNNDLSVSCYATPSSINQNNSSTFYSNVSGGTSGYTYSWSGACSGSSSSCNNYFSNPGTQTAHIVVTSGSQTATADCSVVVNQPTQNLSVSCYASPSSITSGQTTTFISNVSGGTNAYTYSWYGVCNGYNSTCSNSVYGSGTQSATVTVTNGSQSASATCYVTVGQSCTQNYQQRCVGNSMYWYDSCGNQGSYVGSCGNTNASLIVTKTVRNLAGYPLGQTGFANSTYANPSATVMFMITLQNTGNQDAQNVLVRDTLPANLIYNNQLVIACSGTNNSNNCNNNNYYNYSGNITSGINLGTIYTGQTVTITYQSQVASTQNFSFGTTTLNNLVNTTSSNVGYIPTATSSVFVTRATVLGASTISTGLTNNFWVDSFILPLLITLIGIWMWRAGMFFGIEKWLDNKKKARRGYKAEKELSTRIAQIQKFGK